MRTSFIFLFALFLAETIQAQRTRNVAWYIPSSCATNRINGLAIGPICGAFQCDGSDVPESQCVNGIQLELLGQGFVPPILYFNYEAWEAYLGDVPFEHKINGIVISLGGYAGLGKVVNGINLSGLNTETSRINGLSTGLIFCFNQRVNGISIGGINLTDTTNGVQVGLLNTSENKLNGLQIGLFNKAKNLKGVQIGLWNKSDKRALPLLNFQF